MGCLTVVFDYLQYLFGYLASEQAGRNRTGDYGYLTQSFFIWRVVGASPASNSWRCSGRRFSS